jgi:ABC-type transporter Mla MlaB component
MLNDTPFELKWVLQGRLCGQWAVDLQEKWENTKSSRTGRKCTVDLEDVICVDTKGESLLLEMVAEGTVLIASRAYMKHVLKSLNVPQK